MNDLDLCVEVVSRSRQPLRYIWRWISRKPLEIEAWFQKTTNRKSHMGYRTVTWPMTSRDLERSNSWPQYAWSAISRKLLELLTSNLAGGFVLGMPSRHTNYFPESGRGLSHVTPTIFGSTDGYPRDSLASCFSLIVLVHTALKGFSDYALYKSTFYWLTYLLTCVFTSMQAIWW